MKLKLEFQLKKIIELKRRTFLIVIKQSWDNMIKLQYGLVKKALSENEIVEQTNSSFSEY
ncbi:hypothetical protein [Paraclostridium sordellii]|uniref:hypothetical protein n=1 Tax=Paraclostridium sordellii TaxID=1505 RepID=UPI001A9A6EEC|nr:hypothetical protein [Paeniclostridium sordellii]